MTAAKLVTIEKRCVFLERVAVMLALRDDFTDADVAAAAQTALASLVQTAA